MSRLLQAAALVCWAVVLVIGALAPRLAQAHEMSMAEMAMREVAPGRFTWQWTATSDRTGQITLTPQWPGGCAADGALLQCGEGGLRGRLAIDGVGQRYSAAMIKIRWLDGQERVYTVTGSQPAVQLFGSADDRRGWAEVASTYIGLGVTHILGGIDHLLFVIALLFLVGFHRQLVWTISAFTLAHSVTLALSSLGWLTLRSPPVEAGIALSIVLVASEALHSRMTLARRWPACVAFLFGLVHGLGFAGALREIGLPDNHLAVALLGFNVGVEAGQLLTVAMAGLLTLIWQRIPPLLPRSQQARTVALYAIGSLAAWWSLSRVLTLGA